MDALIEMKLNLKLNNKNYVAMAKEKETRHCRSTIFSWCFILFFRPPSLGGPELNTTKKTKIPPELKREERY